MLDLKLVRKDPQAVANALEKKHYSFPVSRFITLDAERKEADIRSQELLAERKKASKQIGALIAFRQIGRRREGGGQRSAQSSL